MGFDGKYGKVTLEKKPDVPEHEPLFVLRGQDRLAPGIVRLYGELYLSATGDDEGRRKILKQARLMQLWEPRKVPD